MTSSDASERMVSAAYDFLAPQHIALGWGRRAELPELARPLGRRAMLVHGSRTLEAGGQLAAIVQSLQEGGIEVLPVGQAISEPTVALVDEVTQRLRHRGATRGDFVLAIGGGSALDLGKAAAAMCTQAGFLTVQDYLEGVGTGRQLHETPLPMLAMPTTGGTGSEATKNAVISSHNPPFKKSLRADAMLPRVVLIDPELSAGVSPQTTAYTGMDAITQCIESYVSRRATPIAQALSAEGLRAALPSVAEAVEQGTSRRARECMAHAALLSGLALANSGLGLAHGVAAALGIHADVPHGLACAVMLPAALRVNREASRRRLAQLARLALDVRTDDDDAAADALVDCIMSLGRQLNIPARLSELGVRGEQLPAIARSSRGNSMSGNPRQLNDNELVELLESLL